MEEPRNNQKFTLNIDLRILVVVLVLVIVGMLALWRPWQDSGDTSRKITITGQATLKAEPDEYQFNPYYERKTTAEVTQLSVDLIKKLKELGVKDSQIKTSANSYDRVQPYTGKPMPEPVEQTTLQLTITLADKTLTQKVQDYLLTTGSKGTITPYPSFSKQKQKELEDKARNEAIADARKRADKTAEGLGAKIGKVLEVKENENGSIVPLSSRGAAEDVATSSSMNIQPGEQDYDYSVQVVFALK